jgi:hypothetical protein
VGAGSGDDVVVGGTVGFFGAAPGDALVVASGILSDVASSGEAAGSIVAPAGAGAAFGFAGAGVGDALAVASGFLAGSSGEATDSAVAVAPCVPVALGVSVDPGGQVIQHSAPAGNDRNANPVAGTSTVSRRDFAFMIHPHSFLVFIHAHFPSVFEKRRPQAGHRLSFVLAPFISPFLAGSRLVTDKSRASFRRPGCAP